MKSARIPLLRLKTSQLIVLLSTSIAVLLAILLFPRDAGAETVSSTVSASTDDAYHTTCGWPGYSASGTTFVGSPGGCGPTITGIRFADVDIPAGSVITNAYIEFTQEGWGNNNVFSTVSFQDSAAGSTFSSVDTPADRWAGRTTFELPYTFIRSTPGTVHQSPDLTAGIQELVDNHGGIGSVVLLQDGTGGSGYYIIGSFDNGNPATLHVEYEPGVTEPGIFVVNSTADVSDLLPGDGVCDDGTGACTLRAAIQETNALSNVNPQDVINFNIPGSGPHTISPLAALPAITDPVIIDGRTEPDFSGSPVIEIEGSNAGPDVDGLIVNAADSEIWALVVNSFSGNGITFTDAARSVVAMSRIGTDISGTIALPNARSGVRVESDATSYGDDVLVGTGVVGEGNLISGNGGAGVSVFLLQPALILGNLIGTDISGSSPLGNGSGVSVGTIDIDVQIGDGSIGGRNVVSGNQVDGIAVSGLTIATGLTVLGNYIGVDVSGDAALGNGGAGILCNHAQCQIGDQSSGFGNVISGNGGHGVISTGGSAKVQVFGNMIGTDASGMNGGGIFANEGHGILVAGSQAGSEIGSTSDQARNVISGNELAGIRIEAIGGIELGYADFVENNFIGVNADGDQALPNNTGVEIGPGATDKFITGNVISGNLSDGIIVEGEGGHSYYASPHATIKGNFIGTNSEGTTAVPNGGNGIRSVDSDRGIVVGGTSAADSNLISGNGSFGVQLGLNNVDGNHVVEGNFIGTDISGSYAVPNDSGGIYSAGPQTSIVSNLVSGNSRAGVSFYGDGSSVSGNKIGTDITGAFAVPNEGEGIRLLGYIDNGVQTATVGGSTGVTPSGSCTGDCNLISGNLLDGIISDSESVQGFRIVGNFIGTNLNGSSAISNGMHGVAVCCIISIGGSTPQERNIISGNLGDGIRTGAHGSPTITGNYVGTDSTGNFAIPNAGDGIHSALTTVIGGVNPGEGNLVSGNGVNGISVGCTGAATPSTPILGNIIGLNASGTASIGNDNAGIAVCYADDLQIGSPQVGAGNIISGNKGHGIHVGYVGQYGGGGFRDVHVTNNVIGLGIDGISPFGNLGDGIHVSAVESIAPGWGTVNVGEIAGPGSGNLIAFNGGSGILVTEGQAQVESNSMFGNLGLGIDLGADGPTANDVGDSDLGASNTQNFPEIDSATIGLGGDLEISYLVDSLPTNSAYPLRIEFFLADSDGEEGQAFLGSDTYEEVEAGLLATANLGNAAALGYAGSEVIVATATDDDGNTSEFSFTVPANLPPEFVGVGPWSLIENSSNGTAVGTVTADDPESDPLTFSEESDGSGTDAFDISTSGLITVQDSSLLDRESVGSFQYGVEVSDGTNTVSIAVTINLDGLNDNPPTAISQSVTVDENSSVLITLSGQDLDVDPSDSLTFAISSGPSNGSLSAITTLSSTTAQVTYTPTPGFDGPDQFSFTVNDGLTTSAPAPVTVTVDPVMSGLEPRSGHTATLLANGQVLVVGGEDANGDLISDIVLYDPTTGLTQVIGMLSTPRTGHTATLLPDGTVLIIGGEDSSGTPVATVEVFDPAT